MQNNLFDLSGKTVVLTGSLGQLGRQYTGALIRHGARLVAIDMADANSEQVTEYKNQAPGESRVMYIQADVTDKIQLETALNRIIDIWQEIPCVLINNAALDAPPSAPVEENGPFESYPPESLDKVLDVNLKGVVYCCQVFGGAMAKARGGSIINISSIYGMVSPNQNIYEYRRKDGDVFFKPVAYSVSKSALFNLTRYLATYWGKKRVRVNTLTLAGVFNDQDPRFLEAYCQNIPIGRMADENEYNGAIVFLASEASAYMTAPIL